jgi:hypothetical protein
MYEEDRDVYNDEGSFLLGLQLGIGFGLGLELGSFWCDRDRIRVRVRVRILLTYMKKAKIEWWKKC